MVVRELVNMIGFKVNESQIRRAEQRMTSVANKMQGVGLRMSLAVTAPLAIIGKKIFTAFTGYEDAMLFLQARLKLTAEEMKLLDERALSLAKNSVFTAAQTADAMNTLGAAGFNVNKIYSATPGVMDLASAANMEIAESARIASVALNTFGLKSEESVRVADSLTTAANSAATNVEDLAQALVYGGGLGKGFNNTLEDTLAILASFAKRGVRSTMAGRSFRAALGQLGKQTPEVSETLAKLSVNVRDAGGKMIPFIDIIEQLSNAGATTTDIIKIFGRESLSGILGAMDVGATKLRENAKIMREDVGAAARQAAARLSGLGGAVRKLQSKLDVLFIKIAKSGFAKVLGKIVSVASKLVDAIAKLSPEMLSIITAFAAFAAAIGPVLLGLALFVKTAMFISSALLAVKIAFFGAAVGAGAFNASLLIIPAIILAIIALIAILVEDFLIWRKGGDSLIGRLVGGFDDMAKNINKILGANIEKFREWQKALGLTFDVIKNDMSDMVTGIKFMLNGLVDFIEGVFTLDLEKAFKGAKLFTQGAIEELLPGTQISDSDKKKEGAKKRTSVGRFWEAVTDREKHNVKELNNYSLIAFENLLRNMASTIKNFSGGVDSNNLTRPLATPNLTPSFAGMPGGMSNTTNTNRNVKIENNVTVINEGADKEDALKNIESAIEKGVENGLKKEARILNSNNPVVE